MASALPPPCPAAATASSRTFSLRPVNTVFHPFSTSAVAAALPIPVPAPVTIATLLVSMRPSSGSGSTLQGGG